MVVIGKHQKLFQNGEYIAVISFYKYLGSILAPFLKWGKLQSYQAKQAEKLKASYTLKNVLTNIKNFQ